ncbi:MAG: hypothetical protein Q6362_000620 [Candidatus Wukongarchaeota archaeon]|nr:hypothetical protein [Candidatus Wukongarchaeota archaeon]
MSKNKEEGTENFEKSSSSEEKPKVGGAESAPSSDLNFLVQKLENNEKLVQKVLGNIKTLGDKIKDLSSPLEQQEKIFDRIDSLESRIAAYEEKIAEITGEGVGKVENLFGKFDETLTSRLETSKDEIVEKIGKDLSLKPEDVKAGIEEVIVSSITGKIKSDMSQAVEGLSETLTAKMLDETNKQLVPVGEKIAVLSEDMDAVKSALSGLESLQEPLGVLTEKISEVESRVGDFSSLFENGIKEMLSTANSFNGSLSEVKSSIFSEMDELKNDVKSIKLAYFEKLEDILEISSSIKEFQETISKLDVENISEKIVEKVKYSLESLIEEQKALKEEFVTKITYVEEELSKGIDAELVKQAIIETVENSLKESEKIQEKMQSSIAEAFEKQANLATRFAKELDDLTHTIEDLKTEHAAAHSDLAEKLKSLKEAFRKLIEVLKKQGLL